MGHNGAIILNGVIRENFIGYNIRARYLYIPMRNHITLRINNTVYNADMEIKKLLDILAFLMKELPRFEYDKHDTVEAWIDKHYISRKSRIIKKNGEGFIEEWEKTFPTSQSRLYDKRVKKIVKSFSLLKKLFIRFNVEPSKMLIIRCNDGRFLSQYCGFIGINPLA